MLDDVTGAMAAGTRDVVTGRIIWQPDDPAAVVAALDRIVYDEASPADCWPT